LLQRWIKLLSFKFAPVYAEHLEHAKHLSLFPNVPLPITTHQLKKVQGQHSKLLLINLRSSYTQTGKQQLHRVLILYKQEHAGLFSLKILRNQALTPLFTHCNSLGSFGQPQQSATSPNNVLQHAHKCLTSSKTSCCSS
jgi:hypothetical protein